MLGCLGDIDSSCFSWRGSTDQSKPPIWFKQRSSKWFIVLTCSYTVFVDVFLYGVIVPVMPFALMQRVGVPREDVQHWVSVLLTVFGAALLVGSPLCGWWADSTTHRRGPFLIGLLMLAGATFMLCFGRSLAVLIIARMLQGLSAAVVWTVSVCIMTDRVGSKGVGVVMGWVTLSRSIAIVVGPLLGGVLYAQAGYYAVYAMTFAFIFIDLVLRFVMIEARIAGRWDPSIRPESRSPEIVVSADEEKQGTGQNEEPQPHSTDPAQTASQQRKQGTLYRLVHRLPPLVTLMGNIRLDVALWGCFLQAVLLTAFDAVLPLFVKATFHWNSRGAGLIFLALVIPSFISPAIGWLSDRHGPRWYAAAGFLLCVPVLVCLRLVDYSSLDQKILLCALLSLLGAFLMFFEIPLWVEIVWVVEEKCKEDPHYDRKGKGAFAQAYGLANVFFASGVMVGPILAGFISERARWGTMTWTLALLCGVSAVPTVIWTGGLITRRKGRGKKANGEEETVDAVAETDEKHVVPKLEDLCTENDIEAPRSLNLQKSERKC